MTGKAALHAEQVQCIMCCKLDGAVHISDTMGAILSAARGMLQHKNKSTRNFSFLTMAGCADRAIVTSNCSHVTAESAAVYACADFDHGFDCYTGSEPHSPT